MYYSITSLYLEKITASTNFTENFDDKICFFTHKKDPARSRRVTLSIWSGQGESNSHIQLGKLMFYH